ncbi:MAG: putative metal-dependent phosphoesterase [Labilithrix sp.]|nr:putative metal-dependent phosphoesterase [Labilithrix sp.]
MFVATDLHGHTHCSDGRATPEEYVEFRRELGMKAIAIADHDVLAAVRQGAAAAEQAGMLFIPALEVTAHLHYGQSGEEQFHVLAYYPHDVLDGPQLESKRFFQRGLLVQARWKELVLEWMSKLGPEDREALDPEGELAKLPPHQFPALQSMILRIVERRRPLFEAFRDHHVLFWQSDGPNKDLFGWTPEEAIDAIAADGAVDVIAHPTRYRDKERTLKVIDHARGIEVYTSRHKAEVAAYFRELAESTGKYWTSSSDDHQNARFIRPPCGTPLRTLERICKKTMKLAAILAA